MWEIYTLYMNNEVEQVAVKYYTDKTQSNLIKYGESLINRLSFDRYEIVRMTNEDRIAKLGSYKILEAYEYDSTQDFYFRGKKISLKTD